MHILGGGGNCRQHTIVLVQAIHMKEVYQAWDQFCFVNYKKSVPILIPPCKKSIPIPNYQFQFQLFKS